MFGFGKKMVPAGTDAPPPNMSLAKWGLPIPVKLDKRFKKAQRLMEKKQFAKSSVELEALLDESIKMRFALPILGYLHVLLLIAYNHGDQAQFPEALELYELREKFIKLEDGWHTSLRKGQEILVSQSFIDDRDSHLSMNYFEKGFACAKMRDMDRAVEFFTLGARHAIRFGDRDFAFKHCRYLGEFAREYEDWERVQYAGELIHEVCGEGMPIDQRVVGMQYKTHALFMLRDYAGAIGVMEEIVECTREADGSSPFQEQLDELRVMGGRS